MRLRVIHQTQYQYSEPVSDSHNEVRLMPVSDGDQTCDDFRLVTDPEAPIFCYDLPTGRVHHFNRRAPHSQLTITAEARTEMHRRGLPAAPSAEDGAFYQHDETQEDYAEYLAPTRRVPLLPETDQFSRIAQASAEPGTAAFLSALTHALHDNLAYAPGSTTVNTPLDQVIAARRGVCQDFTHLMLAACRRQGIPARYVSGYLFTGHRPGAAPEAAGGQLVSGDATHAWIECLLPDGQWYGFDPTNNIAANDAYIKMHHGRDYDDIAPLRGLYLGSAAQVMDVSVRVFAED